MRSSMRGKLTVQGRPLSGGDALKLTDVARLTLSDASDAEVLVFDLPGQQASDADMLA
jgi:hypothetical protein